MLIDIVFGRLVEGDFGDLNLNKILGLEIYQCVGMFNVYGVKCIMKSGIIF